MFVICPFVWVLDVPSVVWPVNRFIGSPPAVAYDVGALAASRQVVPQVVPQVELVLARLPDGRGQF